MHLRGLRFILIGGMWCVVVRVYAQQTLKFDRLTRSDGLSQSCINCMLRDSEGLTWFGTQNGLNLYDGKKFRVFQNQPGDSISLSNNYILSLCQDEEGYIWSGTMTGGLNCFNKSQETFVTYRHSETKNSISENTVWTVLADRKGNIWAGTSKGLNRYQKSSGKFTTYRHDKNDQESISTDMVVSLSMDRRGTIWVGTVDGLCRLNSSTGKFIRYKNPDETKMPGSNLIWSVSETPEGDIVAGTNNGVYLLHIPTSRFERIPENQGSAKVVAWSVEASQSGIVWAGSDKGLFRISTSGHNSQCYVNIPSDPQSISDNNVWCLLPDPSGFLWAGTNNGISKARTSPPLFHLLNSDPESQVPLSSSKITSILEDRTGNLWIGTDGGGLNCISPDRKMNTVYQSSNSALQNNNVWALAEDRDGNIWIGNYQGGLHVFKRKSGIIQAFLGRREDSHVLTNDRVLVLLADEDGKIWIGTRGGGLFCYNPETGRFKNYQHSNTDPFSISGNTILSMAFDKKGSLWIGTYEGGLNLYHPETDNFHVFKKKDQDITSLSDNNVWAILFDKKGRLWLGTQGGLNFSENPGEKMNFSYLSTRDGLNSNIIFGLVEDGDGNIWMSNFSGLTRLDIKTLETSIKGLLRPDGFFPFHSLFRAFDTDHGLQGLEFNQGAYHKGHSGTLYFGGTNGLNYFSEKEVKESGFRPPVVITGLKIFNKEVSVLPNHYNIANDYSKVIKKGDNYFIQKSISSLRELILSYRESVISFEFASLDFSSPHKNIYAYKMVNFDEDWNYVGTQNSATYTNLDAGNYTFLIRGSNADGIWNPTETVLKITIIPPFWRTGWFIILSSFVFLLIIILVIRRIFLNQRKKAQKEKEFMELQLKTIKSQIDPHFAFNAINTIASFIYSEKPDVTYDYFTLFARMIRNILEDNDKISRLLTEEIEFVKNYLELQKMRFKNKFQYTIQIADNVPPGTTVPKMIIQTYAENAVKHGLMHRLHEGLLTISIRQTNSHLLITITDNGVGREKASQLNPGSTRKGLKIMEQIIELYGKLYHTRINQSIEDLFNTSGEPAGTRVILSISLLNSNFRTGIRTAILNKFKRNGE